MKRERAKNRAVAGAFLVTLLAVALGGCAVARESASTPPPSQPPMPGSDRDAHGCIPSAGYSWCARTNRCERPWELAREQGFANTAEAYDRFCADASGGQPRQDQHR